MFEVPFSQPYNFLTVFDIASNSIWKYFFGFPQRQYESKCTLALALNFGMVRMTCKYSYIQLVTVPAIVMMTQGIFIDPFLWLKTWGMGPGLFC